MGSKFRSVSSRRARRPVPPTPDRIPATALARLQAAARATMRPFVSGLEPVESRVMLSASVTYRPTLSDGSLGTPVVFETGGGVHDFSPAQVSLLQQGFATPAYQLFLNVDGIPGGSTDAKHKDAIDILAFNWGADAVQGSTSGGGGGAGKSLMHEVHVTAAVSKASPKLIEALTTGRHEQSADLVVRSSGKSQADFLTINLDDVVISSYQVTTARNGTLQEEFTLNFAEVDLTYRAQRSDGTLDTPITLHAAGDVQDFAPTQRSLLDDGYVAPPTSLQYFLDVDGIPGESTDAKHKDAIDVLAFGWAADASIPLTSGGGGGAGKATYQEMHFVSTVSKASPKLLAAMASGTHIADASFAAVQSGKSQSQFYTINLDDVVVSSYQVHTTPSGQLVEEFTLGFGAADFTETPQNTDGSLGTPVTFHEVGTGVQNFKPTQGSLLDDGNVSSGSTDVFLDLDGIPGESQDAKHKDAIDVLSFSWGGDATGTTASGGGSGAGKSTLESVHVVSRMSKASPLILARLASGEHVASADLTFRKSGKDQVDFLTLNLDAVIIDSYRVTTAPDGTPLEEYTLNFDRADLSYKPQLADGTLGSPVVFGENGLDVEHFNAPEQSLIQAPFTTNPGYDYFLNVDGIAGDSTDSKHKDAIDVRAFAWGGNDPVTTLGSGGGVGKTTFHEFHFLAPVSAASTKLLAATASGLHIKDAVLTGIRSGATQVQFLETQLSDVQVSSYQVVMGAQGQLLEEFTLRFADVRVDYTTQSGATGTSFAGHDVDVQDVAPPQRGLLGADGVTKPLGLDAFLQIDGIKGESHASKQKDAIDVLSFSWGADAVAGTLGSGGAGAGKSTMQELHVVSRLSNASPGILDLLDTGRHTANASLTLVKSGASQSAFYTIALQDVIVSSYRVTTAADGTLLEEYTLAFNKATQTYRPQNSDGSLGSPITFQENGLGVDDFTPDEPSILRDGFVAPTTTDLFLHVDGITGESLDAKHRGDIDVLAFSWGGNAAGSTATGGGGGVGKTTYQSLHFVSRVSKASPSLLDRLLKGQHTKDALFTVRNSGGGEFLKIRLTDVVISSYQVTTALDGTLTEEFTLSFGPSGVTGAPVADAGGPYSVGDGQTVTLDASGTSDPDDDPSTLTYQWDLDGDGIFGETGAGATRGDEVGANPVFSAAGLFGPQTLSVTLQVTDPAGHVSTDTATVTIVDITPPDTTITAGPPILTNQTSATFTFTGSDQGTPANLLTFSADLDGGPRFDVTSPLTLTGLADGVHTLRVYAKDQAGNEDATPAVYTWRVDTVGPKALNLVTSPTPVGSPATLTAKISDLLTGASAIAAAQYSTDGGATWLPMTASDGAFDSAEEAVRATIAPLPAGVYTVLVRGTDAASNTGPASSVTLAVFDRNAGFVTGSGKFQSPAGADPAHPTATGDAKLQVEVKYGKTGNTPSGSVNFSFGNINFQSTGLDYMVISGNTARLAGTGTINGTGDYAFEVTFADGSLGKGSGGDFARVRIIDRTTGAVIYDNAPGLSPTAPPPSRMSNGNLKIHS